MSTENITVVFPGQGSQRQGMGKDFYDTVPVARETFEEASDILGWSVPAMCFGDDDRLNLTEFAQPCILTTEIAMLRAIRSLYGFNPYHFGGHSLGEYTALVAAGAFPLGEALRIAQERGRLMQQAVPVGEGSMAAIISDDLDPTFLAGVLADLPLDVANINSPHQIVISGKSSAIPEAQRRLEQHIADNQSFRFVPLNVSAPFHSRFMGTITDTFKNLLISVSEHITPGQARRVTSNVSGLFHSDNRREIIEHLTKQISGTVQWTKNMRVLAATTDSIFEIGPGRPLREFFKTIGVACSSITTLSAARRIFEPVGTE